MSNATDKEVAFFTCSCEEGILRVDYWEWDFDCGGVKTVDKEIGINFVVPCSTRFVDKLKTIWNILNGRPAYFLTLKQEDAAVFGQWIVDRSGNERLRNDK